MHNMGLLFSGTCLTECAIFGSARAEELAAEVDQLRLQSPEPPRPERLDLKTGAQELEPEAEEQQEQPAQPAQPKPKLKTTKKKKVMSPRAAGNAAAAKRATQQKQLDAKWAAKRAAAEQKAVQEHTFSPKAHTYKSTAEPISPRVDTNNQARSPSKGTRHPDWVKAQPIYRSL